MKNSLFVITASVGLSAATLIPSAEAVVVLGTGTGALLGNDLTDPENNGVKGSATFEGFDATFNSNEEPAWGGEGAWNVFDNVIGANDQKWCCGSGSANLPFWVEATFDQPVILTHFTLANGNDTQPGRDPRAWQILGSNDGSNYTEIFTQGVDGTTPSLWTAINQVLRFDGAGVDFATPAAYTTIRYQTNATEGTTGAHHHLGEFEIFGTVVPEPSATALLGIAGLGLVLRRRR